MPIGSPETGLTKGLLSPSLSGSFEMIKTAFALQSNSGGTVIAREKEDGGVVMSGRPTLKVAEQVFDRHPGDSFQFVSKGYDWANPHDETAVVIWVVSPPIY